MLNLTDLASVPSDSLAPFTDRLRLAVAAYLARFKRISRKSALNSPGPAPGHSRPQDLTQASTRLPSPAGARFESPAGLLLVNEALTHVIGQWRHSLAGRSAAARVMISRAKRESISSRSAFTMSTRRPVTANAISAATCALVSTSAGDRV